MLIRVICVVLATLLCLGCPSGGENTATTPESGSTQSAELATEAPITASTPSEPVTMEGRWLMSVMQPHVIIPALILDLSPGDDPKIVSRSPFTPNWKFVEGAVEEDGFQATFLNSEGSPVVVTVAADGSLLRGNASFGADQLNYVELEKTAQTEFPEGVQQIPTEGAKALREKMAKKEPFSREQALDLINRIGTSPTSMAIYQSLLQDDLMSGADVETMIADAEAMVASTKPWGRKHEELALRSVLAFFGASNDFPQDQLRKWLERTREVAGEKPSPSTEMVLEVATAKLAVDDETTPIEDAQKAVDALIERNPFDPLTYDFRRRLADRAGDKEKLLAVSAELVALPIGLGSMETTKELFAELRGSEEGFDDYLESIYAEKITSFASEPDSDIGESPVLIELFTGGSCPPCVAADIGIEAAEKTFPDNVIVLRYHMDIPAPDPLVTPTGQSRFGAYQGLQGTPSVVVNGMPQQVPGLLGPYASAEIGYRNLSSLIKVVSKTEPSASVRLLAMRAGDQVRIVAGADDIPKSRRVNLVVALAEENIELTMPNGIRNHGMVVRALPAGVVGISKSPEETDASSDESGSEGDSADDASVGADGLPPSPEKEETYGFNVVTDTNLSELSEQLISSLSVSEEVVEASREAITDFGELRVVAFVQDAATGEVLAVKKVELEKVDSLPEVSDDETTSDTKPDPEETAKDSPEQKPTAEMKAEPSEKIAKPKASPETATSDEASAKETPKTSQTVEKASEENAESVSEKDEPEPTPADPVEAPAENPTPAPEK